MAITGTDRGTGTHNASGSTTFTLSPSGNFASGSWAVLVVAADNAGSSGAHNLNSVSDTLGNTWTRQVAPLYDPGAANAGVQGAIFTTPQDGGTLTTGTTITVTFGNVNAVAKTWTLMEVVPTSGSKIAYVTGNVGTGSATANPTIDTGSITSGNMVIGALFNEQGTGQTVTGDGDTTNGNWSAQQTTEIGSTAGGMTVSSQRKVVTSTATQTFNPTLGTSSDVILAWIELTELVNVTSTAEATTAGLSGAATATEEFTGTVAATTAGLSVAASGEHTEPSGASGTVEITTAGLAGAATAAEVFTGTAAATTAGLNAAATATESFPATAEATTAGLNAAATAAESIPGTVAATVAGLSGAAEAVEAFLATLSATTAGLGAEATATESIPGTVAATTAGLNAEATGTSESDSAVISLTVAGLAAAATASEEMAATVEAVLAGLSVGATGSAVLNVTGAAALTCAGLACVATMTYTGDEPAPPRHRIPDGLWTPPYRPDRHPTRRRLK